MLGVGGGQQTQEQLQVLLQHPTQQESSLSTMNFLWTRTTGCQHGIGREALTRVPGAAMRAVPAQKDRGEQAEIWNFPMRRGF